MAHKKKPHSHKKEHKHEEHHEHKGEHHKMAVKHKMASHKDGVKAMKEKEAHMMKKGCK